MYREYGTYQKCVRTRVIKIKFKGTDGTTNTHDRISSYVLCECIVILAESEINKRR